MRCLQLMLLALNTTACVVASPGQNKSRGADYYRVHAVEALHMLQTWYQNDTGLWNSYAPSWWQSANHLTTVLDMARLGNPTAAEVADWVVPNTFARAGKIYHEGGVAFENNWYDDMSWWSIAWLRAYDVTGNETYLMATEKLFEDLTTGWGTNCSTEGMWWDKTHDEINGITNALFIQVAAWLANRVDKRQQQHYIDWATKAWKWLRNSELYSSNDNLVGGGFNLTTCQVPKDTSGHTYSNGALIAGLAELTAITGNQDYVKEAHKVADAVMKTMSLNGVLEEPHINQAHPGQSAPQYKGVFMRGLLALYRQSPKEKYRVFAIKCANSILDNDQNGQGALGPVWNGPFYGPANASPHSSAMDGIVSAWGMTRDSA